MKSGANCVTCIYQCDTDNEQSEKARSLYTKLGMSAFGSGGGLHTILPLEQRPGLCAVSKSYLFIVRTGSEGRKGCACQEPSGIVYYYVVVRKTTASSLHKE